jgi:hypothetical protein
MSTAATKRITCLLHPALKSLCETGCVFREPAIRHAACHIVLPTDCAAPCYPKPCPCNPNPGKMDAICKEKIEKQLLA